MEVSEFVERLKRSRILPPESLSEVRSRAERASGGSAEDFVRQLVVEERITGYQAKVLWRNKGKRLSLGNYIVLDQLGRGGMGVVLKARHRRMERIVAVKVLPSAVARDRSAIERFQREVIAAAQLTHDNIVTAYDADEIDGQHVLVMEYVEGRDLSSIVKKQGPLTVDQTIDCIVQAARGLSYAHERGIVHRDVKPANLLLDTRGTVKILDMGLARFSGPSDIAEQAELTGSGTIMGTVDYMSPEQATSTRSADARSDVYSLGMTLHYLLIGRPAYEGETLISRFMAHANDPIPLLAESRGDVPENVQVVFERMVAKDPGDRYQTMDEVLSDLETCLTDASGTVLAGTAASEHDAPDGVDTFLASLGAEDASMSVEGTRVATRRRRHTSSDAEEQTFVPSATSGTVRTMAPTSWYPVSRLRSVLASSLRSDWRVRGAAFALLGVLLLGAVLLLRTKHGTLRIEITDPEIEVAIKGTTIVLKEADRKDVELEPGKHVLHVKRGDFTFDTDSLILKRGETVVVRAEYLDGRIEVTSHGESIGSELVPDESEAVDLLALLELPRDLVEGGGIWRFEDGVLVSPSGQPAKVEIPYHPPAEYRMKVVAEPLEDVAEETGQFVLGQFLAGRRFQFTLARKGGATGLEFVDGNSLNETTRHVDVLRAGRRVTIECTVTAGSVAVTLDGRTLVDWTGEPSSLGDHAYWSTPTGDALYIAANRCPFRIHSASIVPLRGRGRVLTEPTKAPESDFAWQLPPDAPPPAVAPFDVDLAAEHQQAWADYLGVPVQRKVVLGQDEEKNDVVLEMALIPPGEFKMGSSPETASQLLEDARERGDGWLLRDVPAEVPQHRVRLTHPCYLGSTETTHAQWRAVMGLEPPDDVFRPNYPVRNVSMSDVDVFLARLNETTSGQELVFRLPTEAEWEFSCRAGTEGGFWSGDEAEDALRVGWFEANSNGALQPCGQLEPNPFGLHDVHGNVTERCSDWFETDYYEKSPMVDPTGPSKGDRHPDRGGSWKGDPSGGRSARRNFHYSGQATEHLGFRIAATISDTGRDVVPVVPLAREHEEEIHSVGVTPDGRYAVSLSDVDKVGQRYLGLTDLRTERVVGELRTTDAQNHARGLVFLDGGRLVACGRRNGDVELRTLPTLKASGVLVGHRAEPSRLVPGPGADELTTIDVRGEVRRWNFRTAKESAPPQSLPHEVSTGGVAISWPRSQIVYGSREGGLYTASVDALNESTPLGDKTPSEERECYALQFAPGDETLIFSAHDDGGVELWNLDSRQRVRRFEGHRERVHSLAFLADGEFLVTGGLDKTARIWRVATGRELHRYFSGEAATRNVRPLPSDNRLVGGGGDWFSQGQWHVWDGNALEFHDIPPLDELRQLAGYVTLEPTSRDDPREWRYTTERPASEWTRRDFDDATWSIGTGGFGGNGSNGMVGTEWTSADIWLRRVIDVKPDEIDELLVEMRHDEDVEVYVNGVLALRRRGWNPGHELFSVREDTPVALVEGDNVLAIHCHSGGPPQFIDVGLVDRRRLAETPDQP